MLITMLESPRALDWFGRVAGELELLDTGAHSWRTQAAERLRVVATSPAELARGDADLLVRIAAELRAEEDERALELGLVTWRTLAANEIDELADNVRLDDKRHRPLDPSCLRPG